MGREGDKRERRRGRERKGREIAKGYNSGFGNSEALI
jgi:hypothetical protein